jgi:hypothetical protein
LDEARVVLLPPLAADEASAHHVVDVPRMSRSPRPSIRPWCPPLCVPITPEFDPLIAISGAQPPSLEAMVPQVGPPETW